MPSPGVRLSELVAALSYALDITEGQAEGHAVRTCLIGMRIADAIGLGDADRSSLFYALLLKDLGCSSNAARLCSLFGADDLTLKRDHKLTDWTRGGPSARYAWRNAVPDASPLGRAMHVMRIATEGAGAGREMVATRCERGADIACLLGLSDATAQAIRDLDEHWDGRGLPDGKRGDAISLLGRIAGLAQTVEVFAGTFDPDAGFAVALERSGTWFDPELVDALTGFRRDRAFWARLRADDLRADVEALEPPDRVIIADEGRIDLVAQGFARVIDAKSPFTFRHSERVAAIANDLAGALGMTALEQRELRRAALLHDIGKLGVSNRILDKPDRLTDQEFAAVRRHPAYSEAILERVPRFREISRVAGAHHERLDGRGYHRGIGADRLDRAMRVLAVADVAEALSAERPYRGSLPWEEVLAIMGRDSPAALCPESLEELRGLVQSAEWAGAAHG